jgi:Uma2 family endonuclease
MTLTTSRPEKLHGLTIDEYLELTPDDGHRYQLYNGSLVVSPPPVVGHGRRNYRLDELLRRSCPPGLKVLSFGLGIALNGHNTCLVPDTLITTEDAFNRDGRLFAPAEVLLVAEILSPSNRKVDLEEKPRGYGSAGIPSYWIIDDVSRTLTVLTEPYAKGYRREETIKAGEQWTTGAPFPVTLDPAEIL